jgi:outer membrane protein assembly factor BamD
MRGAWRRLAPILLVGLLSGCGGTLREQMASGTANYQSGKAAFDRANWTDAIADLKAYVEQYPGTELTDDALFYLGQAYVRVKDYALASSQFDRLVRDFPATPYAPGALYWLARCDDLQSHPAPLDQTETQRALDRYGQFLDQYPEDSLAVQARGRVAALRERLAEKRYRNAKLYWKLKQYGAADLYLRDVLSEYPNTRWAGESALLLADVLQRLGKREEAVETLRQLLASAPEGDLRRRAADRLHSLEGSGTSP